LLLAHFGTIHVAATIEILSRGGDFIAANTSILPPGWTQDPNGNCMADCSGLFFGPAFTDATNLTTESCVAFCNQQGWRLAALKGPECICSNLFTPDSCFENIPQICFQSNLALRCPGNYEESCGGSTEGSIDFGEIFWDVFRNEESQFDCSDIVWPGGAALTAGQWRFSYFYNDSITARALGRNSVNLPVPVPRGNMSTAICTTACGNAGFMLAGVEFSDECYCGNVTENNALPIKDCDVIPNFFDIINPNSTLMPCSGNAKEFCGGPNIVSIYTLPGSGLVPMLAFDPELDNFCAGTDCVGSV